MIDIEPQKGAQSEAFSEAKWSKIRFKKEVEIQERKNRLLEATWADLGSFWVPSGGEEMVFFVTFKGVP